MRKATELVSFEHCPNDPYKANSVPIYQAATFEQDCALGGSKYDYTRSGNPTREVLERQIAKLEDGKYGFAFSSGMAAINLVTGLLKTGEHIIVGDDLYGGTYRLITKRLLTHRGISATFVNLTDLAEVERAFQPNTKLVLIETPSNPLQKIANLEIIATLAHKNNALLAVDNSFMSPWLQQPFKFGADIIIHSATKYISGHSDVTGGFIVVNDKELADEIKFIQNAEGSAMAPFECWLALRGVKTLGIRVEKQQNNADTLVEYLKTNFLVKELYYPGLKSHPGYLTHKNQASGAGSILCFTTGDIELSQKVVDYNELFNISVSFGGIHSSISLPVNMSHLSIPDNQRNIPKDLVRISVGIEDPDDLIDDLNQAFKLASKINHTA